MITCFFVITENFDHVDGVRTRPKTPTSYDGQHKQFNDNRPKTPTRNMGLALDNHASKPQQGNRQPFLDVQNSRISNEDRDPMELNQSRSSSEFVSNPGSSEFNSRPPPGPSRHDNNSHRNFNSRVDPGRQGNHSGFNDNRDFVSRGEPAKPGMMRSRTPGPEMFRGHGPDYNKHDTNRPKTPTASDMSRSKTPNPGSSMYGYQQQHPSVNDFLPSRYNNNHVNAPPRPGPGPGPGPGRPQQWAPQSNQSDFPGSPPPVRRDFDPRNYSNMNGVHTNQQQMGGAGRPPKHSASFEEDPSQAQRKFLNSSSSFNNCPSPVPQSPRIPPRFPEARGDERYLELRVTLPRQWSGFGFRIIGGTEEGSQVSKTRIP